MLWRPCLHSKDPSSLSYLRLVSLNVYDVLQIPICSTLLLPLLTSTASSDHSYVSNILPYKRITTYLHPWKDDHQLSVLLLNFSRTSLWHSTNHLDQWPPGYSSTCKWSWGSTSKKSVLPPTSRCEAALCTSLPLSELCWWDWFNSRQKKRGWGGVPETDHVLSHPTCTCTFISHPLFNQVTPGQHIYAIQEIQFPH